MSYPSAFSGSVAAVTIAFSALAAAETPCEPSPPPGGVASALIVDPDAYQTGAEVELRLPIRPADSGATLLRSATGTNLRGRITRVTGTSAGGLDHGAAIGLSSHGFLTYYDPAAPLFAISDRGEIDAALGYGSAGLEGKLWAATSNGVRLSFTPHQGVIGRLGLRGFMDGNDAVYGSLFELPELQLGYQFFSDNWLVEVVGQAGYAMVGRFVVAGASRRKLGDELAWGAHGSLGYGHLLFDADFNRIVDRDARGAAPVDHLAARLCSSTSPLLVCALARRTTGRLALGAGTFSDSAATVAEITIGFGRRDRQAPPRSRRGSIHPRP